MNNLLNVAKEILELNESASLTGTLMLKIRGIDLGREPSDIDIIINGYAPRIKLPDHFNACETSLASDGSGIKYKYGDICIDVMSSQETPELVDGVQLGTIEGLVSAKRSYSLQDNDSSKKHRDDIIKLGYELSEPDDDNNLPF